MDHLDREAMRISPIPDLTNPSVDAQTNPDLKPVKLETSTDNTKQETGFKDNVLSNEGKKSEKLSLENAEKGVSKDSVVDKKAKYGGSLSLARIQSLVSMTTPRASNLSNVLGSPSFIEIDHSIDGFGCLFLPSVFPQPTNTSQQMQGIHAHTHTHTHTHTHNIYTYIHT